MSPDSEITSLSGCLARLFWIIVGPALLLVCAVVIATSSDVRFPGVLDIIYYGLLVIIVIARFFDRPPKQNIEEYKAGLISAVRYIIILSISSIALWLLAHFVVKGLL